MNNMADLIADCRKQKGMTQKQLADKLNVTDKAVSKWERGSGYPDIRLLEPLAEALGISVSELVKGQAQPEEEAAQDEEKPEEAAVKTTLTYAEKVTAEWRANLSGIILFIATLVGLIGILTTVIVDLALNKTLTWSIYPISAILYAWLCTAPLLYFKKHRVVIALVSVSVFLLPFLKVIEWMTGGGWFAPIGLPSALIGLALVWVVYFIFRTRLRLWNKLALSTLALIPVKIGIDAVLYFALGEFSIDIAPLIMLMVAVVFFGVGRLKRKKDDHFDDRSHAICFQASSHQTHEIKAAAGVPGRCFLLLIFYMDAILMAVGAERHSSFCMLRRRGQSLSLIHI